MYPKEFFIEQFQNVESEDLVRKYASGDMTDEANAAIIETLVKRGVWKTDIPNLIHKARKASYRETKGDGCCDYCRSRLFFSSVRDGGQRFCSQECLRTIRLLEKSEDIPESSIVAHATQMMASACPVCQSSNGAVEVRYAYTVTGMAYLTRFTTKHRACCRKCGVKNNLGAMGWTSLFGWWSLYGVFSTPFYVGANVIEMLRARRAAQPSEALVLAARISLAERLPVSEQSATA